MMRLLFACLLACGAWLRPAILAQRPGLVEVLVAYYSETGNTEKMAQGVAAGASRVAGTHVTVKKIGSVTKQDLLRADAVVLGSPVHMGDAAVEVRRALVDWSMKYEFFESKQLQDKVAGVFATGGAPSHGKELTMMSMAVSLLQLGMVLVSPYSGFGASATTATPEGKHGVADWELNEARELGERVAQVARKMKFGANANR
ncbi:MAG TPA: flavodoxin domain-containing protein [Bryobacterales bacterium]|nr:flavodoxin domain-containing protein [Bryobacterales bacterium]